MLSLPSDLLIEDALDGQSIALTGIDHEQSVEVRLYEIVIE